MHLAAALPNKGYSPFLSSRLAGTGSTSTSQGGGLLTVVSSKHVAEHEVLSFTELVPGKAAALEAKPANQAGPASSRPSRHPPSGSLSIPTGPPSVAPRRRPTGEMRTFGSAKLGDYRPTALCQLDMKLLTGLLTERITEVLRRHGVVSDWQQGALSGSNTGPPLFMAQ